MELIDFPIRLPDWKTRVYVHCFGDIHRAAAGCDVKALRRDIRLFKEARDRGELHYWIGTGDWTNSIGPKDRRFDSTAVSAEFATSQGSDLFHDEARTLVEEFKPIAEWGVCLGSGNHEESIAKSCEFHPGTYIAEQLNVPFVGYQAGIRFVLDDGNRKASVLCHYHHGYGASRAKGSKVGMLWSMRDLLEADVHLTAHLHEKVSFPDDALTLTRKGDLRLVKRRRLFILGATYLKSMPAGPRPQKAGTFNRGHKVHSDYGEVAGYRPSVIGHAAFSMKMDCTSEHGRTVWGVDLREFDPELLGEVA